MTPLQGAQGRKDKDTMNHSSRIRSALPVAFVVMAAFASACSDDDNQRLYTTILAENSVELGRQDVTVAIGVGRGRAVLEVPASALQRPARARVRLVSGLLTRGRTPVGDVAVELTGPDLEFVAPARLRQVLAPPPLARRYQAVVGVSARTGFLVRQVGTLVGPADNGDQEWTAPVSELGVWGFAFDEAGDAGADDAGADDASAPDAGGPDAGPVSLGCEGAPQLLAACVPEATPEQQAAARTACLTLRATYEAPLAAGNLNPRFLPVFDNCIGTPTNTQFCTFARDDDDDDVEPEAAKLVETCAEWAGVAAAPPRYRNDAALATCTAAGFADTEPSCNAVVAGPALTCFQTVAACRESLPGGTIADDVCALVGLFTDEDLVQFDVCATRSCAEIGDCFRQLNEANFPGQ